MTVITETKILDREIHGTQKTALDRSQPLIDLTLGLSAMKGESSPFVLVLPELGIEHIAYRADGDMHEIWRDQNSEGTTDLTKNAVAKAAVGDPFTFFDHLANQFMLIFRGTDDHVRSLYWMFGAVGEDNLSGSTGAPKTAGNPAGWYSAYDRMNHAAYRTHDGHLHELWWQATSGVSHGDLMEQPAMLAEGVLAASDPWPYYDPLRNTNNIAFVDTNANLRWLYWGSDGDVHLTPVVGPEATSTLGFDSWWTPFAWFTPADGMHRCVYSAGTAVAELLWSGDAQAPVGRDLTALSNAPRTALGTNISAGYNPGDNSQHVVFESAQNPIFPDGRVHELWYLPGETAVRHVDLTSTYSLPLISGRPVYYATSTDQHVVYRGGDNHIYELTL